MVDISGFGELYLFYDTPTYMYGLASCFQKMDLLFAGLMTTLYSMKY